MPLLPLSKPRPVDLAEGLKAMKTSRKFTVFLNVESDSSSTGVIRWFRGDFFDYKWESYLYPDRVNSTEHRRSSILSISASSKSELASRVRKVLSETPEGIELTIHEDPLAVAEKCKETLALGAQREGGLT